MGLQAVCQCRAPEGSGEVKALLETRELILRGAVRRRLAFAALSNVREEGGNLCFEASGAALELGAERAALWARKILNPPSLASKLGLGPTVRAFLIGEVTDPTIAAALAGNLANSPSEASLSLAVATDAAALSQALGRHEAALPGRPIWIVHGKGRQAALNDNAVRAVMRGAGYIDTKVSAVSETLSATRYARRDEPG
jgi:hypothetical protein